MTTQGSLVPWYDNYYPRYPGTCIPGYKYIQAPQHRYPVHVVCMYECMYLQVQLFSPYGNRSQYQISAGEDKYSSSTFIFSRSISCNCLKSPKPGGTSDPLLFAKVKIYLMSGSP